MEIKIEDGLPFIRVTLQHQGQEITLSDVLLDTGSAGTVFQVDKVAQAGIRPEKEDNLRQLVGIGGKEIVVSKKVDLLCMGDLFAENFEIELGRMDYGLGIDGIIGLDFLLEQKVVIDLNQLRILKHGE